MLSAGTRIGHYRVKSWIKEGSCGQSYLAEGNEGDDIGKTRYVKLFHRVISESVGFSDFFSQQCQPIQQLEGRGIWPLLSCGVMKWKHWVVYRRFDGSTLELPQAEEGSEPQVLELRTLSDFIEHCPNQIKPECLKEIMIDLHCGLHHAHESGVIHGNVKPSNVLLKQKEDGTFSAWLTEFALSKISLFGKSSENGKDYSEFVSQNLQFQQSLKESESYRPSGQSAEGVIEESGDIFALGGVVKFILDAVEREGKEWADWEGWATRASNLEFKSISQSMEAIPGVEDLSVYGIKGDGSWSDAAHDTEEIRKKRAIEWEREQKVASATFRRNITALIGCACLLIFLSSKVYLFLNPSPWIEYSFEGALDRYQLGFGIWSGKAWGILPASYDEKGKGGQDVAGEWKREDGMFRLDFRKFKKAKEEESGKKLWQFIGKGATSDDDYYVWSDYLKYDSSQRQLSFSKRVYDGEVYVPGQKTGEPPRLFPELRIRRSGGNIKRTELLFTQMQQEGRSWSIFISIGFLIASMMYHRILLKINLEATEVGKV